MGAGRGALAMAADDGGGVVALKGCAQVEQAPAGDALDQALLDVRALAVDYPQHVAALVRVLQVVVVTLRDWETGKRPYPYGGPLVAQEGYEPGAGPEAPGM